MLKKISDGFCFGIGFSISTLIVLAFAWLIYAKSFTQIKVPISTVDQSQRVSSDTLKAKECSLLILLYGETQDKDIADPIKNHCG